MTIKTIQKLLESSCFDDILIGLEYIKDWPYDKIYKEMDTILKGNNYRFVRVVTPFKGTMKDKLNYKLKDSWVHINSGFVHIYDHETSGLKYYIL